MLKTLTAPTTLRHQRQNWFQAVPVAMDPHPSGT